MMNVSVNISLKSIQDVQQFVRVVSNHLVEIDLHSGRYIVDGKSIMGIFSLDLLKPIKLVARSNDPEKISDLLKEIHSFVIDEEEN